MWRRGNVAFGVWESMELVTSIRESGRSTSRFTMDSLDGKTSKLRRQQSYGFADHQYVLEGGPKL